MREAFVSTQVKRQTNTPEYYGKQPLNFEPFAVSLSELSNNRANELQALLLGKTIVEIQTLMTGEALSAEELVLFYLRRIRQYDEQFNSFIALNPDVLAEAQVLDGERAAGNVRGPLHGIPILLKDNVSTGSQMPTTAGAAALTGAYADADAFITQQLRDAGALILGKANLSEWANFMTSESANGFSVLGGQTRNPYGTFDVGGSSSGSAAAVAADLVTASVGSETAGSIIYPASQNSVVGLKPSLGVVSRSRVIPITDAMDTAGPMGRSVTDVAVLYTVLATYDAADPLAAEARTLSEVDFTTYLDKDSLQNKRLGVILRPDFMREGEDVVLTRARSVLEAAGAELVDLELELPQIDYLDVLHYGLFHGVDDYLQSVAVGAQVSTLSSVVAYNVADLPNRAPFGQDLMVKSLKNTWTPEEYDQRVTLNRAMGAEAIRQILAEHQLDGILSVSNHLTGLYAPAGFPALTVPAGYRPHGEPLGITFIGDFLSDGELLGMGYAFEQAAGVWRPPSLD